jgi:hypothetical protein
VVAYNTYSCSCCPINGFANANATCDVDSLNALVPNSPVTEPDGSPGVIAGQQFPVVLQAINSSGSIDLAFNGNVSVSRSRTLDSSEIDLPNTVTLSGGSFTQQVMFNRVNGTDQGTTLRFTPSGGTSVDIPITTYFRVVATREGLVGGTTACGHTITQNDHFVALPATGLCNKNVVLMNTTPSGQILTTVRDVGPWFPNGTATQGNPCVGGDDPYWNTGGVPRVESNNCDPMTQVLTWLMVPFRIWG